jgi:hypothetical protein
MTFFPSSRAIGMGSLVWPTGLSRVQKQGLMRIAYMPDRRFVFDAEIDPDGTHIMVPERMDEYMEHELLKRSQTNEALKLDVIRSELEQCIKQGRIVVAFRNARAIHADTGYTGQNPVWYTGAE